MYRISCFLFFIFASSVALAQDAPSTIEIDLADDGAKIKVASGTVAKLVFKHRLPSKAYSYEVSQTGFATPFPLSVLKTEAAATISKECKELLDSLGLAAISTETSLRSKLADAKSRAPDGDCAKRIEGIESDSTVTPNEIYSLGEGQTLTIKVTREGGKNWEFEYYTAEDRQWLVHYGFAFLPDDNEEFHAAANPNGTDYIITEQRNRSSAVFEPTINFTYVPKGVNDDPWKPNFTAGLGIDLDEQLVFVGVSWLVGDNVNVFLGAAGHKQTRLKGIYNPGQSVMDNLQQDQLVDDTFQANYILGIGFRFDGNPFKKSESTAPVVIRPTEDGSADDNEEVKKPSGDSQPGSEVAPDNEGS